MEPTEQPQPAGGQSPDRTQQIIIVLLVIVVLMLGGLLLAQCGDDTEPTTTAAPATTVPPSTTAAPATTVPPSTTTAPTTTVPPGTTVPPSTTTVPANLCNGSALALTGSIDESNSLYLYDLDTATLSNLLPDGSSAPRSPVWSSECDAIFLVTGPYGGASLVQQIDLVSLEVSTIFEYDGWITHLAVHDGGEAFEFTTVDDDTTFVTSFSLSSGEFQTYLELGPHEPWYGVLDLSLSPSGMLILYQSEHSELNIVSDSPELTAQVPLGALKMNPFRRDCCALSPDGQMLAIEILLGDYGDTGGETGMVLLDLATGDTETFTKDSDSPYFYGSLNSPSWASDGSQVVFFYNFAQWSDSPEDPSADIVAYTNELWLASPGAPFATLIASFAGGGEIAWMPGG